MDIRSLLSQYAKQFPGDPHLNTFQSLLNQKENPFLRATHPIHITATGMVLDPTQKNLLILKHKKQNRWIPPGGHADGDENLLRVALKEIEEETALTKLELLVLPFHLGLYLIPKWKDVPEHHHLDMSFLFVQTENEPVTTNNESNGYLWVPIPKLQDYGLGEAWVEKLPIR